jgi:hypothetical protein
MMMVERSQRDGGSLEVGWHEADLMVLHNGGPLRIMPGPYADVAVTVAVAVAVAMTMLQGCWIQRSCASCAS